MSYKRMDFYRLYGKNFTGDRLCSNDKFSARERYYSLRSQIRQVRRHSPNDMDVHWYAPMLGLYPEAIEVTRRDHLGSRVISIGIAAPVKPLP